MTTTVAAPSRPATGRQTIPTTGAGAHLRAAREARGWSLEAAARRVGFTTASIGAWERGDRALSVDRLPALAAAYGVTVAALLGEETRAETSHVVLDLAAISFAAVELPDDTDFQSLHRWVDAVRRQRGDWGGKVLSIRDDDLTHVALILDIAPSEVLGWLDRCFLLATSSRMPVTP